MCQHCQSNGQRTFGTVVGLEPVMPVSELGSDLVACEDTDERIERRDATEDANGNYWQDAENLGACQHCDGLFPNDELDENDGYCESCRSDHYFRCESCDRIRHNDDGRTSEGGDTYCENCYCDRFTSCDNCGCEITYDECTTHDGCAYCSSCAPCTDDSSERESSRFHGRDEYSKIGSRRRFGVELETDRSDGWSDWIEDTVWGAHDDSSVNGKEFVSPVLYGDDGLNSVMNFCAKMESENFRVRNSCGYHLHIDLTNESAEELKRIALAYAYTREFWFACVDSHRRTNNYCHSNIADGRVYWDVNTIKDSDRIPRPNTRYVWCNWEAYGEHSTVEIRLHQGTLNGREVCNWVKAHLRFVDYVKGLTVGQITRIFGKKTVEGQMRNMRDIWRDADLSDYYARKVGIAPVECAA